MRERSCRTCTFAVFVDYGYSNYTVEGTSFNCANGRHPDGSFDRGWNIDPRLDYGKKCKGYAAGDPIEMDVDREGMHGMTLAQRILWKKVEDNG